MRIRTLLTGAVLFAASGSALASGLIEGNGGNTNFIPSGEILPNGALSVRAGAGGCQDLGTGLSVIVGNAVTTAAANPALVQQSAIVGGCTAGTTTPATYGGFDSAAEFIQNYHTGPVLTVTGPTYTATTVALPSPLSAAQTAMLYRWMYILTNSVDGHGRQYGAYLTGWTANAGGEATSLTVSGFMPLGAGTGTRSSVPSTTYRPGTGGSPIVYIGEPNNLFTRNEMCSLERDSNVGASVCSEIDAVNNSGADNVSLSGYRFNAMGRNHPGTALFVGSLDGDRNAWTMGLDIEGYATNGGVGVKIVQPAAGTTGNSLGLQIITEGNAGAIPVNIVGAGFANIFTVWGDGSVTLAGPLKTGGFLGTAFNGGGARPTAATNGNAVIGWNYLGGAREVDFWNTDSSSLFAFLSNSGQQLAEIGPSGISTRGGVAAGGHVRFSGLPTSAAGLPPGSVWNSGGTLKIVP